MKFPPLYLITDSERLGEEELIVRVEAAAQGGELMVQLREKQLSDEAFAALYRRLRGRLAESVKIIVNRRVGLVDEFGMDGLQLGAPPSTIRLARKRVASSIVVGYSAHAVDEAVAAENEGADFLCYSPVFPPISKTSSLPPVGAEGLREACQAVAIPVFALGGIAPENVATVKRVGAQGIAVIGAILDAADPQAAVAALLESWSQIETSPKQWETLRCRRGRGREGEAQLTEGLKDGRRNECSNDRRKDR